MDWENKKAIFSETLLRRFYQQNKTEFENCIFFYRFEWLSQIELFFKKTHAPKNRKKGEKGEVNSLTGPVLPLKKRSKAQKSPYF